MTRKDYELIAEHLRKAKRAVKLDNPGEAWERCCEAVADALHIDNYRFKRSVFLEACDHPYTSE